MRGATVSTISSQLPFLLFLFHSKLFVGGLSYETTKGNLMFFSLNFSLKYENTQVVDVLWKSVGTRCVWVVYDLRLTILF